MGTAAQAGIEVVLDFFAVAHGTADQTGLKGNSGKHHIFCSGSVQTLHQSLDIGFIVTLEAALLIEQERSFGEVRQYVVRSVAEAAHLRRKIRSETRIHFAVISHHRVNYSHRSLCGAALHYAQYRIDLVFADVTGVERIKLESVRLPALFDIRHVARQVTECVAGKSCSVGRKHRRRKYHRLYSAS